MNRRQFLHGAASALTPLVAQEAKRPNVLLIVTDDQGYGDCSLNGNPQLRTPNLDRIAHEGVQFTQFHVSPVCSPTRSSLMTGRYNYRTGVVDTYLGRSMMYPDEVTLAEVLGSAGYATGIFGKWHLGDNYPLRAMDQGFQKSVVIRGGGLRQPSDVPGGGGYFDPILFHDGEPERFRGYCTDIFTNEALRFVEQNRKRPFFAYLPVNAPHEPLEVDAAAVEPFRKLGLDEQTARVYAMVANIDQNVGRVLNKLEELQLARDTVLIFLTDNGPQRARFNSGMRGLKGSVYEGGIRVPCFMRWPGRIGPGSKVDRLAAHIDVFPTLAEACGVALPRGAHIDGKSLMPLMKDSRAAWQDRTLFFQWHRGDTPELYRNSAARDERWKLVNGKELYDLEIDPAEKTDVAGQHADVTARLRREYEAWFQDVSSTRGYAPPRIRIGNPRQDVTVLTRQDWRGPKAGWTPDSSGYWEVAVEQAAEYDVRVLPADLGLRVRLNELEFGTGKARLPAGPARLEAPMGVQYVEIRRVSR